MLKIEKIDIKDVYAVVLIALVAFGIWQAVPRETLPEFASASALRSAVSGGAGEPHIAVLAALLKLHASALGADAASPSGITAFMLFIPPVLLAISSILLYLALRIGKNGKLASAAAALLFALSVSSSAFLPGFASGGQLACLSFMAFLAGMALFADKGGRGLAMPALFAALLFGAAASALDFGFSIACIAIALFYASAAGKAGSGEQKEPKGSRTAMGLAPYAAMVAVFALASFLAGGAAHDGWASYSQERLLSAFTQLPFMIAAASIIAALSVAGAAGMPWLALFIAGILVCGASPLAGAGMLSIAAAQGIGKAIGPAQEGARKEAFVLAAYAAAFFACLALANGFFSPYQALAASAGIALLAPLTIYLYSAPSRIFFAVFVALLAALAIYSAVFYQFSAGEGKPEYLSHDVGSALLQLSSKNVTSIITLERQDAVAFYLPKAVIVDAKAAGEYLLAGKGADGTGSGQYVVASPEGIGTLAEKGGFGVYSFSGKYSSGGREFAVFSTRTRMVSREISANGGFALRDGAYLDNYGRQYATVPLSRMFLLMDTEGYDSQRNRLIVLEDGAAYPHFLAMYSGKANESGGLFGSVLAAEVK